MQAAPMLQLVATCSLQPWRHMVGERVTKGIGREVRDMMTDDILQEEQPETSARQSESGVKDWSE